jgi:hypothetical protein
MSVKLRTTLRNLELHFWWEVPHGAERIAFRNPLAARSFLARLVAEGHSRALHRLAADRFPASQRDDAMVLDGLAALLASGHLRIAASPFDRLTSWDIEEREEPVVEARRPTPPPEEERPVEEALPPEPVDQVVQANALKRAAKQGAPFCEECERAKRAAATR